MRDRLLVFDAEARGLRLAVCTARELSRDGASRHGLQPGSAAAFAQALVGAVLVAATEDALDARVDVQLECGGPLRGLLVDADSSGAVRGLVRVPDLDRNGRRASGADEAGPDPTRFDARAVLASGRDEEAGLLSVLRAHGAAREPHRAVLPFAGADLGAALTLFLRGDRALGGELALEVLYRGGEPLAAVAGALLWSRDEDGEEQTHPLGKRVRQGALRDAMVRAEAEDGSAAAVARHLAESLGAGDVRLATEMIPHFRCRCSRDRVVRALRTLGAAELRDMAEKDGGASATCDFCAASYRIMASELLALAAPAA